MGKFSGQAIGAMVVVLMLVGCVTTSYRFENQTYASRDEAWAAASRKNAEAEAAISTGAATPLVDRKLIFVIPTAQALIKSMEARGAKAGQQMPAPGTPIRAQIDFNADAGASNVKSIATSLKKANVYRDVDILEVDTTTPNIQPTSTQDVVSYYLSSDSVIPVYYFLSEKYGKQIIAVDMGASSWAERRKSLIDDVKAKALQ